MVCAALLTPGEIDARLVALDGWSVVGESLHKEFTFVDFEAAFAFMTEVADAAERLDHHPDWSNSWNKVVIDIVSHAAHGITETCFGLAEAAELAATGHQRINLIDET